MNYQKLNDGYIRRMSDLALIPENEGNKDYQAFLADEEKVVEVVDENAVVVLTEEQIASREELVLINARLEEIDKKAGPRAVREVLLELGKKGFENKIETLEAEAAQLRLRKKEV